MKLSLKNRDFQIKQLLENKSDLLIIGGGITGAGIALDASSRGIKTGLLEMQDFAAGTSSRSTKLVHGGLRYLEHLELGLVREVGREREIVHTNAAHIVIPEKMILPIIEDGNLGEFTTSIALYVYDYLAGVKKEENRRMLSRKETIEKVPLIDSDLLKSGALYYEYKTDDSRLTIEVLKKATEFGANLLNYAKVDSFIYEKNKVIGVTFTDVISNKKYKVFAKNIVNATGPWVDKLRGKDSSLKGKRIHHTKGIHIVIEKKKFPLNHAIYFDTGDKRMVFAIPREDIIYIGTTDTDYSEGLENPTITKKDVGYLLKNVNRIAPKANIKYEDVQSAWSGLRPLIHEEGKDPSELSRKDEIFHSDTGLISIAGGKLTGYRIMAKNIVKIVAKRLAKFENREFVKCQTKNMRLSGGEFPFYPEKHKLIEYADMKYDEAKQTGISTSNFKTLFYRYGTNIDYVTNKAYDYYNECKDTKIAWLKAEIWYCVNFEAATSLADFFIRRTGMIFFYIKEIYPILDETANFMSELLDWNKETKQKYINEFNDDLKRATVFE
ncbi:MAG: glycerol-3-phosphate dehydrogenase/oxidase [Bacteroidales bacterium]|nr:glycerol-3-phosphate dehydrogenase/oxidase [Bacteroidales bacterium]